MSATTISLRRDRDGMFVGQVRTARGHRRVGLSRSWGGILRAALSLAPRGTQADEMVVETSQKPEAIAKSGFVNSFATSVKWHIVCRDVDTYEIVGYIVGGTGQSAYYTPAERAADESDSAAKGDKAKATKADKAKADKA